MTTTNSSSGHALLRAWRPVAPRTWTIAQIRRLRDLACQGVSVAAIAACLGKTESAVRNKAGLHGISLKGTRPARREGARSAPAARARLTRLAARSLRGGGQPG